MPLQCTEDLLNNMPAATGELHRVQVCSYAALMQFALQAQRLKIRWVLMAGSLAAANCFGAMAPEGDHIDVQVAFEDSGKLLDWWAEGKSTLDWNYDEHWHQRYVLNDTHLLYKFARQGRYKLVPLTWRKFEKWNLGGLDIHVLPLAGRVKAFYSVPFLSLIHI